MALDLVDYERKTRNSVKDFWRNRAVARQKQIESGKADQGERAGVTAGKNMDGSPHWCLMLFEPMDCPMRTFTRNARSSRSPVTSGRQSCGISW